MGLSEVNIVNAIIESVRLGYEHGVLTASIVLDYGGSGQGFGGYCLYNSNFTDADHTGFFVDRVLDTVGVDSWESLVGKAVRAKQGHTKVHALGHYLKDKWFEPGVEIGRLVRAKEDQ